MVFFAVVCFVRPCSVSRAQAACLWGYRGGRPSLRGVLQPDRDRGSHPENARKVLRRAASAGGRVR